MSYGLKFTTWTSKLRLFVISLLAHTASRWRRSYILPLLFFLLLPSFVFLNLISEVTEWISTKLEHIFTYDCYLKNLVWTPLGICPPWAGGQKNVVFVLSTVRKKLVNLQGLPYMPPNLVNSCPETTENGWRVFTHPLNFRIGRHCQPYRMDVI